MSNYHLQVLIRDQIEDCDQIIETGVASEKEIGYSTRVLMKFPHRSQVRGYVLSAEVTEQSFDQQLVQQVVDAKPILNHEIEELVKSVCSYYKSSLFCLLETILPFSVGEKNEYRTLYYEAVVPHPCDAVNAREYELYEKIKQAGFVLASEIGNRKTIDHLLFKKYICKVYQDIPETTDKPTFLDRALTSSEEATVKSIIASDKEVSLLQCDSKNSRIEVFLELTKQYFGQGKSVLLLLPIVDRQNPLVRLFQGVFKDQLSILDKRMSNQALNREYLRISSCRQRVVIGSKKEVFAPIADLGLIIIEEEENRSYKQNSLPKYSARKVAVERMAGRGRVVLASGSPAIESMARASRGLYQLVALKRPQKISYRLLDYTVGEIDTVSILLTKQFRLELKTVLDANRQAVLFLPKRGYAPRYKCRNCGSSAVCPNCSALLTYYKDEEKLICNHCGFYESIYDFHCTSCGGRDFLPLGYGTMRLEEELGQLFPEKKIVRIDYDTVLTHDYADALSLFASGGADILVGTRQIASGFPMKKVGLVAALDIDNLLELPSYTIEEDTYDFLASLLELLDPASNQAYLLSHYGPKSPMALIARQDYDEFYAYSMEKRQIEQNPPYTYLVYLTLIGPEANRLTALAARLRKMADDELKGVRANIVGPSAVKLAYRSRSYQSRVMIKYKNRAEVDPFLNKVAAARFPRGVVLDINIDPEGE